jgi:hypothetical protein
MLKILLINVDSKLSNSLGTFLEISANEHYIVILNVIVISESCK